MRLYVLPGPGSLHMYILLLDLLPYSYTDWNVKLTVPLILIPWSGMNFSSMQLLAFIV
jgi:hypothetical protein